MEERKFRYDAFISYRHTELDKFVAANLIKQLEAYKLPKSVAKKLTGKKTKIERVFRDREELPLTNNLEEPIVEALQNTEWLIVICSPRLPESMWCKKEIETFISLRGREHVLAVLIEGEPAESFPEELLYKTVEVKTADGAIELIKEPVEPLAADFRGKNGKDKKGVAKAMKTEILRILAAIFGVAYDDLRQRHRERRMRRIVTASLLIGAGCLAFGVYSTMTALRIKKQKEQIEVQSEQILEQSREIQLQSEEILKQNEEITWQNEAITKQNEELALRQALSLAELATRYYEAGDNKNAIKTAVEALTESDGIKLPYTPEAQYILTDSLRAYDAGAVYKAGYQYEMSGRIEYMNVSPDGKVVALEDSTGALKLFDLEQREEIATVIHRDNSYSSDWAEAFLSGNRFAFIDEDKNVSVYSIDEKKVTEKIESEYVLGLHSDKQGKYLLVEGWSKCFDVYAADTLQRISTIEKPENLGYGNSPFVFTDGILADSYYYEDEDGRTEYTLYFWNIESGQLLSACNIGEKNLKAIQIRDGVAYALLAHYQNTYMDCDTYVTAISMESGKILWENKLQGLYPHDLRLPGILDGTQLICTTTGSARLMDMETGEISFVTTLESNAINVYTFTDSENYLLLLENGGMAVVSREFMGCYDMSARFECKSLKNSYAFHTVYGMVIQAAKDNKFIVYTAESGPDVKEITEEVEYPEVVETLYGVNASETALSYGLERPEYIYKLYHSEDGKFCIVHYWDNVLVIYDVSQKKVLNTIEDANSTDWYLGTDAEGYTYLLSYEGCYVLDKDMKPIAWIADVRKVDLEKRKLYMVDGGVKYEAPVYTLEELLEIAKEK